MSAVSIFKCLTATTRAWFQHFINIYLYHLIWLLGENKIYLLLKILLFYWINFKDQNAIHNTSLYRSSNRNAIYLYLSGTKIFLNHLWKWWRIGLLKCWLKYFLRKCEGPKLVHSRSHTRRHRRKGNTGFFPESVHRRDFRHREYRFPSPSVSEHWCPHGGFFNCYVLMHYVSALDMFLSS